jgi:flagellin
VSLGINTNIDALNALRNLGTTSCAFSESVRKLSSGLRINTAADDAAGLAIATRLASQVSGLDQAGRNAQDGVSMIQTAEGALSQVQTMLQRIRELSVEAANGTLSQTDAQSADAEITALASEITRTARTTSFNGHNLLDGSLGKTASASGLNAITGALPNGVTTPIEAGSLAGGTYTLTAATSASPGAASTIGGASGLGTSNDPAGFSASTAIDDATSGLLTQTGGGGNSVSGISNLGAGLGGVTSFTAGTLNSDTYALAITSAGQAATIGDKNTLTTVTGATAIDSVTAGLATATGISSFTAPTAVNFGSALIGDGFGTMVNQGLTTGGNLAPGQWILHSTSWGTQAKAAVYTLQRPDGSGVINLTNTNGVLTDAASGFHLDISGLTGTIQGSDVGIWLNLTAQALPTSFTAPTAVNFGSALIGDGFGTMVNQGLTTGGNLAPGQWILHSTSWGTQAKAAVYTLQRPDGSGVINLTNTNGVLTDAASGFHLDISGLTGTIQGSDVGIWLNLGQNSGVDTGTAANRSITLTDAFGGVSSIALSQGETFQQVADAINTAAAGSGQAKLAASVGAHGLVITNAGVSANSSSKISVAGAKNTLTGLGFLMPTGTSTSGGGNPADTVYTAGTTPVTATGSAATATLTDQGSSGQATLFMTGAGDVFTDAGTGFRIDLSAATGGTLVNVQSALLTVGSSAHAGVDTTASQSITLTDETGANAAVTLAAGETFQQVIDAINATGLGLQASFGSGGIKLTSTGSRLAASIGVQGSDDALRGLGFEAADGATPSTANSTIVTGSVGTASSPTGGPMVLTLTGTSSPIALTGNGGVYSDGGSGFRIDLSGASSLSAGSATITVAGTGATFQIGANRATPSASPSATLAPAPSAGHGDRGFTTATNSGIGIAAAAGSLITATDTAIRPSAPCAPTYGAVENRLNHTVASIGVASLRT